MNERLFVYGIFLDPAMGRRYDLAYDDRSYAVLHDWATVGAGTIVSAVPARGYTLAGLMVEIDPADFGRLDVLEGGYKRIRVRTSEGLAWMYADPSVRDEDHNTWRLAKLARLQEIGR